MRQPGSTSRRLTGKEETHPGGEPVGFIIREWVHRRGRRLIGGVPREADEGIARGQAALDCAALVAARLRAARRCGGFELGLELVELSSRAQVKAERRGREVRLYDAFDNLPNNETGVPNVVSAAQIDAYDTCLLLDDCVGHPAYRLMSFPRTASKRSRLKVGLALHPRSPWRWHGRAHPTLGQPKQRPPSASVAMQLSALADDGSEVVSNAR